MTMGLRAHRLDIVAVGIEQERREIGRAVVVAMTGGAVVATAGLQALGMKLFDGGMVGRAERDMGAIILQALVQIEPERRLALRPKTCAVLVLRAQHMAERRECCRVEAN